MSLFKILIQFIFALICKWITTLFKYCNAICVHLNANIKSSIHLLKVNWKCLQRYIISHKLFVFIIMIWVHVIIIIHMPDVHLGPCPIGRKFVSIGSGNKSEPTKTIYNITSKNMLTTRRYNNKEKFIESKGTVLEWYRKPRVFREQGTDKLCLSGTWSRTLRMRIRLLTHRGGSLIATALIISHYNDFVWIF